METLRINEKTRFSAVVDWLRFPMAVLVVLIHMVPVMVAKPQGGWDYVYNSVSSGLSYVVARVAVPLFFFISGYLYFRKATSTGFATLYKTNTRKRIRSLLVPYLCWCVMPLLALVLYVTLLSVVKGVGWDVLGERLSAVLQGFSLHVFWDEYRISQTMCCFGLLPADVNSFPLNMPLWFVRNLWVLTVLSPILYYAVRKAGKCTVAVLAVAYLSNTWIPYSPLNITGFFFFTLGCFIALHVDKPVSWFSRHRKFWYIVSVLLAVVCTGTYVSGNQWWYYALRNAYSLCGVMAALCVADRLVARVRQPAILAQSSFFVFASHTVLITGLVHMCVSKALSMVADVGHSAVRLLMYLLDGALTVAVCLMLYALLKIFVPKLLGVLTGNRT